MIPRRALLVALVLSGISLIGLTADNVCGAPLLKNGGFEELDGQDAGKPAGWIMSPGASISAENPHMGKYCLALDKKGEDQVMATQIVTDLPPDRYYQITFSYHAEGDVAQDSIYVDAYSKSGIPESFCHLQPTVIWRRGTLPFYSGKGGPCNVVLCIRAGKSTIKLRVDDVVIQEMTDADFTASLLLDSGFESGEIGKMAPGWERFWFADQRYEGRYARCGIDATQSHTGNNSLRIDFPQDGFFTIRGDDRIILPDVPYTFSLWAKANSDGAMLRLAARGPFYAGKDFLINREWQKLEFTFTIPKEKLDASETKRLLVAFDCGGQKAETTYWVDDASWAAAKNGQAENFVPNGSFEFAANPSFPDFWGCYWSANFVPFYDVQGRDDSTAAQGQWSQRINARQIDFMGAKQFRGSEINVWFDVPASSGPADHTLSAYFKSDRDDTQVLVFASAGAQQHSATLKLTKEWQRYSLSVPFDEQTPRDHMGADVRVQVGVWPKTEGTYWIDAVQFEKGAEATVYKEAETYAWLYKSASSLPPHPFQGDVPVAEVVWTQSEPVIDGRLDDQIWRQAAHIGNFVLNKDGSPAKQQTEAWVIFTPSSLCVAFKCYDDRMDKLKADVKERNGPVYEDDCVELFVETTNKHDSFFQFAVNTINTRFCKKEGDGLIWDADWKTGVAKGDGFWTAEISVPLSALKLDASFPDTWGINFCRENHKVKEYSQWSCTRGSFLTPSRFGYLAGVVPGKLSRFFWRIAGTTIQYRNPLSGQYNLLSTVENRTDREQDVIVETSLSEQAAGRKTEGKIQLENRELRIPTGGTLPVPAMEFTLKEPPSASGYLVRTRIRDKESGTVLYDGRNTVSLPVLCEAFFERSFYMNEPSATLAANLHGCEASLLKNLSVRLRIEGREGKIIERRGTFSSEPRIRLDVDIASLPEGRFPATIEIRDASGSRICVKRDVLTKLSYKPYAVPVDRVTKALIVDGRPFVPYFFGLGAAHLSRSMIPEIAAAGFNGIIGTFTVFDNVLGTDEEIQMFLDDCQRHGLKFIFWIEPGVRGDIPTVAEGSLRYLERVIPKFRGHPAVIAWKFADEWWDAQLTGKLYRRCRELDPHRPAYRNVNWFGEFTDTPKWLAVSDLQTDIYSGDIYPFGSLKPKTDIEDVAQFADSMAAIAAPNRMPAYMWCQGFGYDSGAGLFREPSPSEQDAMIYLLQIHGVSGVYYFFNRPNARECFEAMKRLRQELKTLEPVLLGAEPERNLRLFQPDVQATMIASGGKIYILASHTSSYPCSFSIPLGAWEGVSGKSGKATVLFENRTISVKDGALSDAFSGYGRHVYVLEE